MAAALSTQICRVVAPDKLADRLLLSGCIGEDSTNLDERPILLYAFEITKTWLPSSQLLPSLVSVLESEYPKLIPPGKDCDDRFEEVLRSVNQQLNAISEAGETDWIGSFNGILLLMAGNELHFSQSGHYPAYLLQNNRIRQITDDITQEGEPHPLKTFSNLASGYLQGGDCLLIANQELYSEISLDALRRIIGSSTPFASCQTIARQLKKDRNPNVSASIIRVTSSDIKRTPEPTFVDLELEMQSPVKKLIRTLTPFGHAVRDGSKAVALGGAAAATTAAKGVHKVTTTTVIPGATKAAHKTTEGLKKLAGTLDPDNHKKTAPPADEETTTPQEETPTAPEEPSAPSAETSDAPKTAPEAAPDEERIEEPAEEPAEEPSEIGSVIPASEFAFEQPPAPEAAPTPTESTPKRIDSAAILHKIRELLSSASRRFLVWFEVPKNKKVFALIVGILLIGITVWGAMSQYSHNKTAPVTISQNDKTLEEVSSIQERVAQAMSDPAKATEASQSVEEGLRKLQGLTNLTPEQVQKADASWDGLTTQSDILTSTTRLQDPRFSAAFTGGDPQKLIVKLPYFYAYADGKGEILRTGKGTLSQVQKTITLPNPDDIITAIASGVETDTAGYVLTRQSNVFRIVNTGNDTTVQSVKPESGTFASGDTLATFLSNLYVLDGKIGLFWRYAGANGSFGKGVNLIDENQFDITGTVSVAIDGAVYFLRRDGSIDRYTSSRQTLRKDTAFALRGQPYLAQKLTQAAQIVTDADDDSLYVLDKGMSSGERSTARIVQYSKNGDFVRQIAFPKQYTNVKSFQIHPKDKLLWILNGSDVHEFVLP